MGCDIHSVAQVKKNGKWTTVFQDVAGDERSYNTFGALANVRNGRGFGGAATGTGLEPLDEPRGLPSDFEVDCDEQHPIPAGTPSGDSYSWADDEFRSRRLKDQAESTAVWMGDHSHSHCTLAELIKHAALLKESTTVKYGIVPETEYLKLKEAGKSPESYCGGIYGRGIISFTEREYLVLKRNGKLPTDKEIHVQMAWTANQLESTRIPSIIEELSEIRDEHGVTDEEVRYVFGFDS